jgi:hypothetical protein
MRNLLILLLCTLPLLSACKKEAPSTTLPEATQEGKNTAGFLLDGQVWVPFARCGFSEDPCREISGNYGLPYADEDHIDFRISRIHEDKHSSLIFTGHLPMSAPGDYSNDVNVIFLSEETKGSEGRYTFSGSSSSAQGSFILTKVDHENQIISGTFSFTLRESNGSGKSIEITDGRFDFKMNACICR